MVTRVMVIITKVMVIVTRVMVVIYGGMVVAISMSAEAHEGSRANY